MQILPLLPMWAYARQHGWRHAVAQQQLCQTPFMQLVGVATQIVVMFPSSIL